MRSIFCLFVFLAMLQSAYGASPGERALAWSESQRDAALGAVLVARKRVEAAESDLTVSRNVERDISDGKDAAALAVAREAVTVSEQGLTEAQNLLRRATAHLSRQEKTLAAVRKSVADNGSNRALVVPMNGEVRRNMRGAYIDADPSTPLRPGERVEVGPNASARLFVAGGDAEVALSQNSSFTVTRDGADGSFEALLSNGAGRLRAVIKKHFNKFEVRTPTAVTSVRGTDFSLLASPSMTRIEVFKGIVQVRATEGTQTVEVHAGEGCEVLKDGGIQPVQPLDDQPRDNPWSTDVSTD
jgi:ferric-dicitrate binding protein FerR (iron transport regulator)